MDYQAANLRTKETLRWAKLTGILPKTHRGRPTLRVRDAYDAHLTALADQGSRFDA